MVSREQQEALRRKQEKLREQRARDGAVRERTATEMQSATKKKSMLLLAAGVVLLAVLAGGVYALYAAQTGPGPLDDFAKCLTEKGAVVYGAISWCEYTKEQRGMFGPSWRYIHYEDFSKDQRIKVTPTWLINGQYYEKVQSMDRLAGLTGCALPG
ncbi:hypothetical protein J4439_07255 [Candidatus Woesearchaeota archaeon]|nr:hypothetical protein [Candidatus Woesearchaeota archaeon]